MSSSREPPDHAHDPNVEESENNEDITNHPNDQCRRICLIISRSSVKFLLDIVTCKVSWPEDEEDLYPAHLLEPCVEVCVHIRDWTR